MNAVHLAMVLGIIALPELTNAFQPPFFGDGVPFTHRDITVSAILRKTAEVCREVAAEEGRDFTLDIDGSLTVSRVQRACSPTASSTSPVSTDSFENAITVIYESNADVDFNFIFTAERHFDDEEFVKGRRIITEGMAAVKSNVALGNFEVGRETLGTICHTLQDFYSHSNWVELGNVEPNSALIHADQPLTNLAGKDVPTCQNCEEDVCKDNILPNILENNLLTSGYFGVFSSKKPAGKCSHGGRADRTSRTEPKGGINKDTVSSEHGYLHNTAAALAVDATIELLEDIRIAIGDKTFLRFMGLSQSAALCFCIDTTGSMSDDIAAAKATSFDIIDSRRGTAEEPSLYILVPFNDPDFGPVIRTTDPDVFKAHISDLTARGGGDAPEFSMSGLQLALTAAPPSSDIFLFTDARAKDFALKNTIIALIESTKTMVTCILTNIFVSGRRRRDSQSVSGRFGDPADAQIYRDLARASGGQTIEISKLDLIAGTAVIKDLSSNAVVTIFQVTEDSAKPNNFTFLVDSATSNIIIFITGVPSLTFRLTSPSGILQMSSELNGSLASISTVGNLRRVKVNGTNETGIWILSVSSSRVYTVKVTGQSSVNFLYNLVERRDGAHGGIFSKEGRPTSGSNVTLLVTVTGSDTAEVTQVTLSDSTALKEVNATVTALDSNNFLAEIPEIPAGDFVVNVIGQERNLTSRSTPGMFQRQASTRITTSRLSVTSSAAIRTLEPGSNVTFFFTVSSDVNGTFSVQVNNDRSFAVTFPENVIINTVEGGGTANGTVTLTAPASVESGTDVTVTIEVQNAAGTEINFAVVRFSVVAEVTDTSGPACQVTNISGICPTSSALCASSHWELTANLTDGINGTGIRTITLREGNGSFSTVIVTEAGVNVTLLTYNASCCTQNVVLAAVDGVGNVGRCVGQARVIVTTTAMTNTTMTTPTTQMTMTTPPRTQMTTSDGRQALALSHSLWIVALVALLLK